MKYSLMNIKEYVHKLAEVISEVLRVDVEIVDINFTRISGTGRYRRDRSNSEGENFVYKKVIETGKKQVVENPGFHKLCADCSKKNSCLEKFECCTPIKVEEEVIGVISLICFTDAQKKIILDKFKEYADFLDKISDLIATKAKETCLESDKETMMSQMKAIMDFMQDNVVVVDEKGIVQFCNDKFKSFCSKYFKSIELSSAEVKILDYGERLNANYFTQFSICIDNVSQKVLGYINDLNTSNGEKSRIILFQDIKKIHKTIYEHTEANRTVEFSSIVGVSKEFQKLIAKCKKVAAGSASVLITGESGTGKEMFARAIHYESSKGKGPFIAINCGAIPDTLLESELFGYVPGAFSGASKNGKIGKFELANKGTIFLDEIGDMPLHLQVKLLRVLQEKVVIPIGSNKPISIDVRIISATNKNLEKMVKDNEFREDLYYRLNVIPIEIPPLRTRKEDIPILINFLLEKYCSYYQVNVPTVSAEALQALTEYKWFGNVREMENTVEYIINILQDSRSVEINHLPTKILDFEDKVNLSNEYNLEKIEKEVILRAIKEYGDNTDDKRNMAKALGISLATLYRKMDKYGITKKHVYEI